MGYKNCQISSGLRLEKYNKEQTCYDPVQGARPFIYKGLHLALECVAVKSLNIYGTKIWRSVQFYIPLYPRKESCCAFNR